MSSAVVFAQRRRESRADTPPVSAATTAGSYGRSAPAPDAVSTRRCAACWPAGARAPRVRAALVRAFQHRPRFLSQTVARGPPRHGRGLGRYGDSRWGSHSSPSSCSSCRTWVHGPPPGLRPGRRPSLRPRKASSRPARQTGCHPATAIPTTAPPTSRLVSAARLLLGTLAALLVCLLTTNTARAATDRCVSPARAGTVDPAIRVGRAFTVSGDAGVPEHPSSAYRPSGGSPYAPSASSDWGIGNFDGFSGEY